MKICRKCGEEKELSEFGKDKGKKDGRCSHCRSCRSKYMKQRRQQPGMQEKINGYLIEKREAARENLREYLCRNPCTDCGESNWVLLEFDHVRGEKDRNISVLVAAGYRWELILEEIAKCDVVCANCHKLRTYSRMNTYRTEASGT